MCRIFLQGIGVLVEWSKGFKEGGGTSVEKATRYLAPQRLQEQKEALTKAPVLGTDKRLYQEPTN